MLEEDHMTLLDRSEADSLISALKSMLDAEVLSWRTIEMIENMIAELDPEEGEIRKEYWDRIKVTRNKKKRDRLKEKLKGRVRGTE